jgi:oligopeptide transport system substrate-binding protein
MRSTIMKRRTGRFAFAGAAVCVAALVAFGGISIASTVSRSASKAPSNTLRVAVEQPPDPFDPATLGDNRTIELAQNVFDGLTDVSPTTGAAVPALATSWTLSPSGKVYTFHLRKGAKFQNGDPVTAADFVYSWNRTLSPKVASPYLFFLSGIAGATAVSSGKAKAATGIKALNPTTLQVTLTTPAGYFPELVSRWPFWVVDPKVVAKYGSSWDSPPHIVGTGAYQLTNVVGDTQYTFKANPLYFAGAPKIGAVTVDVVADPTARVARYQAGEFDAVFGLSAAALRQAQDDPTLKSQLHVKQQLGTSWLGMNNAVKPFNNIKVREAFSDAIDRKSLITVALDGLGHPTGTFLPPGLPGAIANTQAASKYGGYDVTKAQALLAAAGYPGGKGFPAVTIDTDNVSTDETVMQYVQAELEQNLHITIGIKSMPQNAFNALFNSPKTAPPLYSYAFSLDYPDAQEMLQYFATSGPNGFVNYEHYSSPAFDNLVNRAVATANDSKRAVLYNQAETLFMSAQPVVPLYNQSVAWLAKPYASGVGQTAQYMAKWDLGALAGVGG